MAFGFDSSIPLSAPQTPQTSLSELVNAANSGVQRQQQLYALQRQQTLADIARQTAGNYADPTARAYAQGGFGAEADDREKLAPTLEQMHAALLRDQASTIKSEAQYKNWASRVSTEGLARYGLERDTYDPQKLEAFLTSGLPVDKRGAYEEQQRRRDALGDLNSVTSRIRASVAKQLGLPVEAGTAGNAIDDKELDLGERAQAARERARTARIMMGLGQDAEPVDMSKVPGWVKTAAVTYNTDGSLPTFKDPGGYTHKLIMRVADALRPGANIPLNRASYKANEADLQEATTQSGQQDVKEHLALSDIQSLRTQMKDLFNAKSPLANEVGRGFQKALGDPAYKGFTTALELVLPSINATVNSGQMSVGARQEVKELLDKKDSLQSIDRALSIIENHMSRSTGATHARISNAKARIAGTPAAGGSGSFSLEPGEPPPGQGAAGAPAVAPHPQDSKAVQWAKAHLKDSNPDAAEMAASILRINGAQ